MTNILLPMCYYVSNLASGDWWIQLGEHRKTNGQTDRHEQVHYLPRFAVDNKKCAVRH